MTSSSKGGRLPRLHLVTDDRVLRSPGFIETAGAILTELGGDLALHLRGHGLTGRELYDLAIELVPVARAHGALLLVNDRGDVALGTLAGGVHLGRRSIPISVARDILGEERWIGYSAHTIEELELARREGADFVVYGTIFPSATHPGEPTAGLDGLRRAATASQLPLIAIGGMNSARVREVHTAGAYGVAVLGAIWHADQPLTAAVAIQREIEEVSS